jgi:uncharacterized protein YjdB
MALTPSQILNTILDNASDLYTSRVPVYTRTNLKQVGDQITADKNIMNEFMGALINKVALSNVKSKMYNNPLARLKQNQGVPYGSTIEEIFVNPAVDQGFSTDGTKLLKQTKPDGKTAYYGVNRQSTYAITVTRAQLQQAFTSEQSFMALYTRILSSMYSGDQIDEFMLTKEMIAQAIDEGAVQVIRTDISDPKTLQKSISKISKNMSFPSTEYAGYNRVNINSIENGETPCITFCDPSRQVLLLRADAQTEINFEVLATLFHIDIVQLEAMTILVDAFPSTLYDIDAVLCDIDAIQVIDSVFETDDQKLGSALSWNYWLHHWQFLFVSMFGNMVAFGKSNTEVTGITISGTATITTAGGTTQLNATIAPSNASVKTVIWTSSDKTIAKVNANTGLVTALKNGTVIITATATDTSEITQTQTITITGQAS